MASNFPTSLDSFSNPSANTLQNSIQFNHATVHSNIYDAIDALEAKVGITNSQVSDSIEYRLSQIETVSGTTVVKKTESEWTTQDPLLLNTQIGLETDTLHFKFGNGENWSEISYANITSSDLNSSLGDYILSSDRGSANGVASLNSSGVIPDTEIPSSITRDTELSAHASDTTNIHGIADTSLLATQSYADNAAATAAAAIVASAPSALNTLNELAAALGDDANYATTITTSLGLKQDKVSGVSDTEIGYLDGVTSSIQTQIDSKASLSYVNLLSYGTAISGTSHTVSPSDMYKITEFTNSSTVAITVPDDSDDSDFPIGSTIEYRQMGDGRLSFTATSPATLVSTDSYTKSRTKYSSVMLEKRASNAWILTGDIDA